MPRNFLDKIYKSNFNISSNKLYKMWAPYYDKELTDNQYVTPFRCAQILNDLIYDKEVKILDVGCGTGLSGNALRKFGFYQIDGLDFSIEMLKIASEKKIYNSLLNLDLKNLSKLNKRYEVIIASGVISPDHANPNIIKSAYSILDKKGLLIFSLNDHALRNDEFFKDIQFKIRCSNFTLLDQIYGDHIKGLKLNSSIFILQKN